jgi:hypothetical protein
MCVPNKRLLPISGNQGDSLFWDDSQKRWITQSFSVASFDATLDQDITGKYSFAQGVNYLIDEDAETPTAGFKLLAIEDNKPKFLLTTGKSVTFNFDNISDNRTITFPNESVSLQQRDKGMLTVSNELNSDDTKPVKDNSGNTTILNIGKINAGLGGIPHASEILGLKSTTKGFSIPKLTNTQVGDIDSPIEGLLVFNDTKKAIQQFIDAAWQPLIRSTGPTEILDIWCGSQAQYDDLPARLSTTLYFINE